MANLCVVSNLNGSGMSWVVDNLETGLHFEPGADESLAGCLIQLLGNHDNIRMLGNAGARKLDQLFKIDVSSPRITTLYSTIMENGPKGWQIIP
jgi:glycosyltransferase involved in cell wall biosynthesis